jgi:hypothetical protein
LALDLRAGHHVVQYGAVLGAVKVSVLRIDRVIGGGFGP